MRADEIEAPLLAVLVSLPLVAAAVLALLAGRGPLGRRPWIPALAVAVGLLAAFPALAVSVPGGSVAAVRVPWIPSLGVDLALRLDGLALLFALMVTGVATAILGFSVRYLPHHAHHHHVPERPVAYYALLLLFMGSMLGLVCADDVVTLYTFWEATSISSFLLIGLDREREAARAGAVKALALTVAAGLPLLVALLAAAAATGTGGISAMTGRPEAVSAPGPYGWVLLSGVLVGAAAKSAQAPLHTWLPDAMEAPTPVSAFLHSAAMVAAGVFLVMRLAPLLDGLPGYRPALQSLGAVTLLMGAAVALTRDRLKQVLAFSTISQYGYVTLLLGLQAYGAAAFYVAAHAVLKSGLFLSAGLVSVASGQDDLRRVGPLARTHPFSAAATWLLALGLGGAPLVVGFWMKELFYKAAVGARDLPVIAVALVGGILTLAYMGRYAFQSFHGAGPAPEEPVPEREMSPMVAWVGALALLALALGLRPAWLVALTDPAASVAAGAAVHTVAALGWPPPAEFGLTLATYALAVPLARFSIRSGAEAAATSVSEPGAAPERQRDLARIGRALTLLAGSAALYDRVQRGVLALARLVGRTQSGLLWSYVAVLSAVPVALAAVLLTRVDRWPVFQASLQLQGMEWAVAVLSATAILLALASVWPAHPLTSLLLVAGVGYVIALVFTLLRAPDLALVQVAVETVIPMLLLLAIGRMEGIPSVRPGLPARGDGPGGGGREVRAGALLPALLAVLLGTVVGAFQLGIAGARGSPALAAALLESARVEGWKNVVAMVLVDQRAMDTLGEAAVFAAATLGAVLILSRRIGRSPAGREGE